MIEPPGHRIDLAAYFSRIGYSAETKPTAAALRRLHFAHITRIPFENVSALLERPVPLDPSSLERKLVGERRGGYCFEQNGLFSAVLEELGFEVTRLAARVRLGAHRILPRTHMLLLVQSEGVSWVCDVGFGGWGLLEPIPLEADRAVCQVDWTVRLQRDGNQWVLQSLNCPAGPDLYAFTLEPQQPIDYEPANHYCATHPNSRFVQTFTVQLPGPKVRTILRGRELSVFSPDGPPHVSVLQDDELLPEIERRFGLSFSNEERDALRRKVPT